MKLIIWAFCQFCYVRTEQEFDHEDSRKEYYKCKLCKNVHSYAVR